MHLILHISFKKLATAGTYRERAYQVQPVECRCEDCGDRNEAETSSQRDEDVVKAEVVNLDGIGDERYRRYESGERGSSDWNHGHTPSSHQIILIVGLLPVDDGVIDANGQRGEQRNGKDKVVSPMECQRHVSRHSIELGVIGYLLWKHQPPMTNQYCQIPNARRP